MNNSKKPISQNLMDILSKTFLRDIILQTVKEGLSYKQSSKILILQICNITKKNGYEYVLTLSNSKYKLDFIVSQDIFEVAKGKVNSNFQLNNLKGSIISIKKWSSNISFEEISQKVQIFFKIEAFFFIDMIPNDISYYGLAPVQLYNEELQRIQDEDLYKGISSLKKNYLAKKSELYKDYNLSSTSLKNFLQLQNEKERKEQIIEIYQSKSTNLSTENLISLDAGKSLTNSTIPSKKVTITNFTAFETHPKFNFQTISSIITSITNPATIQSQSKENNSKASNTTSKQSLKRKHSRDVSSLTK